MTNPNPFDAAIYDLWISIVYKTEEEKERFGAMHRCFGSTDEEDKKRRAAIRVLEAAGEYARNPYGHTAEKLTKAAHPVPAAGTKGKDNE